MKSLTKLILVAGAGVVGYSVCRTNQLKQGLEQITVKISGIRNIKVDWDNLTISVLADLQLINPTNINIGLGTAGAIKIKRIAFINRNTGALIGEALTDITGISIEKQNFTTIKDIAVTIPVLKGLLANIQLFNNQKELLAVQLTISILGKDYTINS